MWRPWKQASVPLAWNRERSNCSCMSWAPLLRRLRGRGQRVDQRIEALVAHEADHLAIVHQHHWRVCAGAQAFALLHGEQAIGCRAALFHLQTRAQMRERLLAIAKLARQVGADVQLEG